MNDPESHYVECPVCKGARLSSTPHSGLPLEMFRCENCDATGKIEVHESRLQPCGHHADSIVSSDEGTAYCGDCERGLDRFIEDHACRDPKCGCNTDPVDDPTSGPDAYVDAMRKVGTPDDVADAEAARDLRQPQYAPPAIQSKANADDPESRYVPQCDPVPQTCNPEVQSCYGMGCQQERRDIITIINAMPASDGDDPGWIDRAELLDMIEGRHDTA